MANFRRGSDRSKREAIRDGRDGRKSGGCYWWSALFAPDAVEPPAMSIDKSSSGLPEMNVHRKTTKVNLSMVVGVVIFFVVTFSIVWWFWSGR